MARLRAVVVVGILFAFVIMPDAEAQTSEITFQGRGQ